VGTCSRTDAGQEVVYEYVADVPHALSVEVFSMFEAQLYVRQGACLAGEEVACVDSERLVGLELPAGTYYLFVDGRHGLDRGPFTLEVTWDLPQGR